MEKNTIRITYNHTDKTESVIDDLTSSQVVIQQSVQRAKDLDS